MPNATTNNHAVPTSCLECQSDTILDGVAAVETNQTSVGMEAKTTSAAIPI